MIGTRFGSWIVEEEIGRGGMGTVWRAARAPDAAPAPAQAAIKILAPELAVEVGFQQRFQREIEILGKLEHPSIVKLYESGVNDNRYWFAMEFVDGPSFEELKRANGRVTWIEVLDLVWQIAPALKHAHDRGIIHRDLKPSNLLRASDGTVKLTDFGIASLFASPHLTVTGGVIGTPEYLSPEQATGRPITRKSDLYSLGVVLYTLVTGTTPFTGTAIELLHKHRYGQFERPSRLEPTIPLDLETIICGLLEKDPDRRPSDGAVLFRQVDSLRNKLARIADHALTDTVPNSAKEAAPREGPATMMSRLMREELEAQNRPGPISRFIHHPIMLVLLFSLCVGILVWRLWPDSPDRLFASGAALMASENTADWETAWDRYFSRLEERYPDHPYHEEVAQFKAKLDDARAADRSENRARLNRRLSEGEWFYEKGMRQHQAGNNEEAQKTWRELIAAFSESPAERPWVRRAEKALIEPPTIDENRLQSVKKMMERVKELGEAGKKEEVARIRANLLKLYHDDLQALKMIGE
jgi:serine/threonine-protein kinase